jgi:hypothetical protein
MELWGKLGMRIERSPFLMLEKSTVIGYLESAGSRDPDVLHDRRTRLVAAARLPKRVGLYLIFFGIACTVLILPAPIGIPAVVLGYFTHRRGVRNLEAVEAGWAEFHGAVDRLPYGSYG